MSVSDPLLKTFKGHANQLIQSADSSPGNSITDGNEYLQPFCTCLEHILQKGLIPRRTLFNYYPVTDAWNWLESLADTASHGNFLDKIQSPLSSTSKSIVSLPFSVKSSVLAAKGCGQVRTARGKLRVFIRNCLVKNCIHIPINILMKNGEQCYNYRSISILGDEILAEIFYSVLSTVGRLQFKLNLANNTFLDDTWQLPRLKLCEFVPCQTLGLHLSFVENFAVIAQVKENSVASESCDVEVGDVLSEVNGTTVTARSNIQAMLRKGAKKPVVIVVLKALSAQGYLYPPIQKLLQQTCIDPEQIFQKQAKSHRKTRAEREEELKSAIPKQMRPVKRIGLPATYVGQISTGNRGEVTLIPRAIETLRANNKTVTRQDVIFECQELGVLVTEEKTSATVFQHLYMEISSCGQTVNYPDYFAYIAGDGHVKCSKATTFTCYIFYTENKISIEDALMGIGQGFRRTHYAV